MENIEEKKKEMKNIILIPSDFSEVCDNAVLHGVDLAKEIKYKIVVLHVINKDTKNFLKKEGEEIEHIDQRLKKYTTELSKEHGIDVNYIAVEGNIFNKIGEVSEEIGASLIILGTHGKVGFQRLTGSYAMKIITSTNVPTVVVQKRSLKEGYKNIVFPVSISTKDRQKVQWAIYIAKIFGSTIHIFPKFESDKYTKKKIMTITRQIKDMFLANNVAHVDQVSEEGAGNFSKQVVDYAVVNEADLIMIMTSTDTFLPIIDSWAEQVIFNSSQIPVICINPIQAKLLSWR